MDEWLLSQAFLRNRGLAPRTINPYKRQKEMNKLPKKMTTGVLEVSMNIKFCWGMGSIVL